MFDPICGMKLDKETPFKDETKGELFYFCSPECEKEFKANREKYYKEQPIIKLEDVWKVYDLGKVKVTVLQGLSLRIFKGDFAAIIGPSGSGKTTAMNMVGALDIPSRGKIYLEGQDISELTESDLAQIRGKKIGFVFQQFNLVPSLSALENVMLPQFFQNVSRAVAQKEAERLLDLVGLKEREKHHPAELSGGEQQRVAIARALIGNPDIILADEPTGNLDSKTGKIVIDILIDLWQKGKTLIIVTHDPYVASFAKKILNLHDGKLQVGHTSAEQFLWEKNGLFGKKKT
jgi:putative ABC transport system ATP-binding protein